MSTNPTGPVIGPVLQAWFRWKALRLPWRKRFLVGLDLRGNTYWEFRLSRGDPTSHPGHAGQPTKDSYPFRRIIHYPRSTHLDEVSVPPAWHQWLRYQRQDPPTLDEQRADVARQARMKTLAAEADARWAAKPSYLDHPTPTNNSASTTAQTQPTSTQARARTRTRTAIPPDAATPPPPESGEKKSRRGGDGSPASAAAPTNAETDATQRTRGGETEDMAKTRTRIESEVKAKPKKKEDDPWKAADDARRGGPSETWQPQAWDPSKSASSTPRGGRR